MNDEDDEMREPYKKQKKNSNRSRNTSGPVNVPLTRTTESLATIAAPPVVTPPANPLFPVAPPEQNAEQMAEVSMHFYVSLQNAA